MSSFTEATYEPVLLPNGRQKLRHGRKVFRTTKTFRFYLGRPNASCQYIEVPAGTETDWDSTPLVLKAVMGVLARVFGWPDDLLVVESTLHDYMRENTDYSKLEGDCFFLIGMHVREVPAPLKWLAFVLVLLNYSRTNYQKGAA